MNTFKSWLIANIEVVLILLTVLFMVFVTFYSISNFKQTLDGFYLYMLFGMAVISIGICSINVYVVRAGPLALIALLFLACIGIGIGKDYTKDTSQELQIQRAQIQDFQIEAPLVEKSEAEKSLVEEFQVEGSPVEEPKGEELQIEESSEGDPQKEESQVEGSPLEEPKGEELQIEESSEGDPQKEVSQAEGFPVEEPKGEELQKEESSEGDPQKEVSRAEGSPLEEPKGEELQIEESPEGEPQEEASQIEESPVEESQVDESHIQEKESTEKTEWEFLHLERLRLRWFIGVAIIAFLFGLYCAIYANRNFDDVVSRRFLYRNSDVSVFEVQWKYTFNRLFAGFITVFAFALEIMCFIVIKP